MLATRERKLVLFVVKRLGKEKKKKSGCKTFYLAAKEGT